MRGFLLSGALALALSTPSALLADTVTQQITVDCDVWIDLGAAFAADVSSQELAQWLIARDSNCEDSQTFEFVDPVTAQRDACLLLDIDPVESFSLNNIVCGA